MYGIAIGVASWYARELLVDGIVVNPRTESTWAPMTFGQRIEMQFDTRNFGELLEALAHDWTPACAWEHPCHRMSCGRCRRRWLFSTDRTR